MSFGAAAFEFEAADYPIYCLSTRPRVYFSSIVNPRILLMASSICALTVASLFGLRY